MSKCHPAPQLTVNATVTAITPRSASIRLAAEQAKNCAQCQGKGGCKSLSIQQFLFSNKPLTIINDNYHQGQKLSITFPNSLIQNSVYRLLGLPLLGFISGICVGYLHHEVTAFFIGLAFATLGYVIGKKYVHKSLKQQLVIRR